VILSESLKQKLQSASLHSLQPRLSPPRHKNKDLYACLHRMPYRNVFNQSNAVSRHITALAPISNILPSALRKDKRRKKSKIFTTPIPILKPQGVLATAFQELEQCLGGYFEGRKEEHLAEEVGQLKKLVVQGIPPLKLALEELRFKDQVFLDPVVSLMFHAISTEASMADSPREALYHLMRAEYYSLRCRLLRFASYCLAEQALVHRETSEIEVALGCLRKGLAIAVQAGEQELVHAML
jgi:hypothetical protein